VKQHYFEEGCHMMNTSFVASKEIKLPHLKTKIQIGKANKTKL
jgi:hypothetical protein